MRCFAYKTAALTVALAAAGLGFTESARANALATAVLEVTNFQIQSTSGTGILDISAFTISGASAIQDNGNNSASLSGYAPISTSGNSIGGAPLDVAQACLGVVCPGANNFGHTIPPVVAGNQLARGDSNLDGAPVTGLGQPTGANARTVSEVQLTGTGVGSGDSDLGLNTSFSFTLAQSKALRFDFDADLYLRTFLSADLSGGLAQASSSLVFTIIDSATQSEVFRWDPNGAAGGIFGGTEIFDPASLQRNIAALVGGDNFAVDLPGSQHYRADTNVLAAGSYRFTIRHTVAADANQTVPEPGTLLLAGGALLGIALSRRVKKA